MEHEGGAAAVQGHVLQAFEGDAYAFGVVLVVVGDVVGAFGGAVRVEVIASGGKLQDDFFSLGRPFPEVFQHLLYAWGHVCTGVRADAVAGYGDDLLGAQSVADGQQKQ